MKKNILSFIRGLFLGAIFLGFFLIIGSILNLTAFAHGGSECSQASDCTLLDNPGNSSSYQNSYEITKAVIKAGTQYFTFTSGSSDDGCYKVNISGKDITWDKYAPGPDCKDVSDIQLWEKVEETTTVNPPSFPSCTEQTPPGDRAHYSDGIHGIVGVGNFSGSDDVYSLSDKNFVQCYCPTEGSDGIQTNWWNIQNANLTDPQLQSLKNGGWMSENGQGWGLYGEAYLAKNSDFNCGEPSPTPTPTGEPTPTVTPQPTATPTPGPTTTPEPEPACTGLSASPTEGTAPLTVVFNGSGFDKNGPILAYEFDFGDSSDYQPQVWQQTNQDAAHRYENPGTYIATLRVKDQGGQWRGGNDACKVTIKVTNEPQVLGASTPPTLPKTGGSAFAGFALVAFGSIGSYLYKRFRLV